MTDYGLYTGRRCSLDKKVLGQSVQGTFVNRFTDQGKEMYVIRLDVAFHGLGYIVVSPFDVYY